MDIFSELHSNVMRRLIGANKVRLVELLSKTLPQRNSIPSKRKAAQKVRPLSGRAVLKRYMESKEIRIGKTMTGNNQGNIVVINPQEPRAITGL